MDILRVKINGVWTDIPAMQGKDYVLTETDKQEIGHMYDDLVDDAEAAAEAAGAAQTAAEAAATSASSSASAAAVSASNASTSAANAAASEASAQEAAEVVEQVMGDVAQETTAQEMLTNTQEITTLLRQLAAVQGRIGYYDELPEEGEEGYTYITPEGTYHYENGEYVQLAGGGSGSLNGFSLSLDASNRVVLGYVNPEDETDTAEAIMPTDSAGAEIVEQLKAINASLYSMIPTEG